jgi:spermidine synthase
MSNNVSKTLGINNSMLLIVIFVEGFLIMGVELISSSIITPYFGSSLTIWTFILGVTMFSLACGYFLGAYLSKLKNINKTLFILLFLIVIFIMLIPYTSISLFRAFINYEIETTLLFSVLPFLFPPLFLLGSISPIIIKKLSQENNSVGQTSGKIYALSTIAGILSALICAFFLMELLRSYYIIYIFSLVSLLTLVFCIKDDFLKNAKKIIIFIYIFSSILYFNKIEDKLEEAYPPGYEELYKSDGILGQVLVVDDKKNQIRTLSQNNSVQTIMHINKQSVWQYVHKINRIINHLKTNNAQILMAGLGGGNLVQELNKYDHNIDIVEIDKRMPLLAEEFFGLKKVSKNNFIIDDFRHFVKSTTKKYDFVIIDLSAGENAPSNVYTQEAFSEIKKLLNKDGVVFIHYYSTFDNEGMKSVLAIGRTLESMRYKTGLFIANQTNETNSVVYVTSRKQINLNKIDSLLKFENINFSNGILMTDDRPILDVLRKNIVLKQKEKWLDEYKYTWKMLYEIYGGKPKVMN